MTSNHVMEMNPADEPSQPLCQIITPLGMLGYGFDETLLFEALENRDTTIPTAIIIDSGSTDSGPSKLAMGSMTCPRNSYKRDLTKLVQAFLKYRVPVFISSAGGDGSNEHVDEFLVIIKEILSTLKCPSLNVVTVYSEIAKELIDERLDSGNITGCGNAVPVLSHAEIDRAPRILAQMGPEPILDAINANLDFDIVIAGRAYDPAPFVAFAAFTKLKSSSTRVDSIDPNVLGGFYHMGKIMECGGVCATPKSRGASAVVYSDGTFDIAPMDPTAKCTPLSVAAHTLYEKTRPDILHGPGGFLDLTKTLYKQLPDGVSVRVWGGRFEFSVSTGSPYTVKLEGARVVGFRTLFMGSFIDPILYGQLDKYIATTKEYVRKQYAAVKENWKLEFHIYGLPTKRHTRNLQCETPIAERVFIIGEVLADTQDLATGIASTARVHCTHGAYEGQMATSGNFAFGIGGLTELIMGPCCEFSVYHLMNILPGEEGGQASRHRGKIVRNTFIKSGLFPWEKTVIEGSSTLSNFQTTAVEDTVKHPKPSKLKPKEIKPVLNGTIHTARLPEHISTLRDVAKVIRSKNAGPFEITFDVIFDDADIYNAVKSSDLLNPDTVAKLFDRDIDDIIWCGFFDQALAFKVTLPRRRGGELVCSGGYLETDVHGSQEYMPLMRLELDKHLVRTLQNLIV